MGGTEPQQGHPLGMDNRQRYPPLGNGRQTDENGDLQTPDDDHGEFEYFGTALCWTYKITPDNPLEPTNWTNSREDACGRCDRSLRYLGIIETLYTGKQQHDESIKFEGTISSKARLRGSKLKMAQRQQNHIPATYSAQSDTTSFM
ncbi:hypothetical protein E2P81_ATG06464 [Venturia nashicola]|uniref:Uncharacterized protein n=1 Tax=Venturia nashicola TaxID=86259 RepID=A0A4Z1P386_9PEZI|nr:hypothetical protein E6O75_ATG06626 [Venturia nashicola]TLD28118.1 hypothetical protein E2P81_ATG06464 [Venturia nashicola]